ncbi:MULTISPECIES: potassium transporter Trk [Microbacterium]|uniref:potassium transporter Trk n=1 Tax=Microbacterium TaxID=33882 RepID=UPI002788ADEA|nr:MULTISPECIES: potassium transporter Trk [Microbacterium]MDQ1074599.1 putative membrane protein [Microbacterium sp. SORGH_AS_0969]MDQ1114827.1 putative membrane protein [Microbacterium testaceum]
MAEQPAPERPSFSRGEIETASVRRAPKYGVFLAAGAFVGILVALILTFAIDSTDVSPYTQVVYSQLQVFGFTALICVVVGVTVAAIVALIFERVLGGRTRQVIVDHEQHGV